jgi:hypothetical protein
MITRISSGQLGLREFAVDLPEAPPQQQHGRAFGGVQRRLHLLEHRRDAGDQRRLDWLVPLGTVGMCSLSGAITTRRLARANPAELF